MSGHSKWAQIKRQKGLADKKRGVLFSRLVKAISIAAREGGNPHTNYKLRLAIDAARKANMPKENIEKAILRGTGKTPGVKIENILYEGYGPGGTAILIEVVTDNRQRTVSELRRLFSRFGGSLSEVGSVQWMFKRSGYIKISPLPPNKEDIELSAIEAGAEDVQETKDGLEIFTKPEDLKKIVQNLKQKKANIAEIAFDWQPKTPISLDAENKKKIDEFFSLLNENEDIQEVYTNLALE